MLTYQLSADQSLAWQCGQADRLTEAICEQLHEADCEEDVVVLLDDGSIVCTLVGEALLMAAFTFLQMLQGEVARMQTLHPERTGELARATAMIVHGQVLPRPDDPATGQVLSSDLHTTYSVNGTCSCQAGQHGRDCKHQHAWKLYLYIQGKVEGQTPPVMDAAPPMPPLPEAPASVNVRVTISGREVQWTLRDSDEARLAVRLEALLQRYPMPEPPSVPQRSGQGQETGICPLHQVVMKLNNKNGKPWFSHKTPDGWCKGK